MSEALSPADLLLARYRRRCRYQGGQAAGQARLATVNLRRNSINYRKIAENKRWTRTAVGDDFKRFTIPGQ